MAITQHCDVLTGHVRSAGEGIHADEALREKVVEWKPTTHELMVMITLSIISFMVALDACIVVTSLSSVVLDLGATSTQGFWIGTAYLLTNAVFMPYIASLSDLFGRPICVWISLVFFTAGSIICCLAKAIVVMLVGRCIQGIGGGGIVILSLVIFTDIAPLRFRPRWYGIVQGAWALGNSLGPVLGGAIAEKTTWRWIFYVMFPFCAIGLVAVPVLLTLKPRTATMGEKLRKVDWVGGLLFVSSVALFLVAISWGGTQFGWGQAGTLVPLLVGAVGLGVTCLYESKVAKQPFLKRGLFCDRSAMVTYACGCLQGIVLYGQLYYIPMFFLSVKNYGPLLTGVCLLPAMLTLVPLSLLTGALITRTSRYRPWVWMGWILLTAGTAMTAFSLSEKTTVVQWVFALILIGSGHGGILTAQNFATQANCPEGEEANAAAMYGFLRQFGMALGVGIGGSAFQNIMALKLEREHLPVAIAQNSEAFIHLLHRMDAGPSKTALLDSYVYGINGVNMVYTGLCILALLASLLIRHHDLNKAVQSTHKLADHRLTGVFGQKEGATLQPMAGSSRRRTPSIPNEEREKVALGQERGCGSVSTASVLSRP